MIDYLMLYYFYTQIFLITLINKDVGLIKVNNFS
jgi:hypothetical protein